MLRYLLLPFSVRHGLLLLDLKMVCWVCGAKAFPANKLPWNMRCIGDN